MPVLNIEVGDDGKIVGELPDALKGTLQSQLDASLKAKEKEISDRAFNEGFQKGNAKKAEELRPHLQDPAEKERLKTLEQENEKLKIAELERDKKYEEANKIREERHAKELLERDDNVKAHKGKLRGGALSEIKAAALKYGAREESLGELALILGGEIDFDDTLEPFVKGSDGKPAVDSKNQPLTIEGRVKQYLAANRHHVKAPGGAGGGAPGGASLENLSDDVQAAQQKVDAAQKALADNPRDNQRINDLMEAERALKRAQAKG